MSWFPNRFSASFKAPEEHRGDDEQDDEHTSHGKKGVKEDLSELTKTFTRQLWGVASFLAPPPTTNSSIEQVDPSPPSFSDRRIQPNLQINPFLQPGDISLSNELVDVDFQASIDPAQDLQEEALDSLHDLGGSQTSPGEDTSRSSHFTSDHGLSGIGKDLAELKGSVATGFSKILKAVREEIDRNDQHNAHDLCDDLGDEDDQNFDDDPFDELGHQKSRPFGALNLQRTLGESLVGISKLASTLFPVNLESDDEQSTVERKPNFEAVGVTEEVLAFARNISMHPETWLDFPLFTDDDDDDDFEMSDPQKEHVHEVERASPRLAALRIELCPDYMTEGRFWKIYFVLLHSRLSKKDAVLLSTPQIMEARALLLSNLQKKEVPESTAEDDRQWECEKKDASALAECFKIVSLQSAMEVPSKYFDHVENLGASQGRPHTSGDGVGDTSEEVQNKNVLASTVKLATPNYEDEEADADRWLHEETSPHLGTASAGLDNEDDISFSDLEEDGDSLMLKGKSPSLKARRGGVELNKDQEEQEFKPSKSKLDDQTNVRREPNDWLTVEEDDSDFS